MSEQNYQAFWNEVLNIIHEEYRQKGQEDEFKLWFNMEYVKDTLSEITVSVPSEFMWKSMVQRGYVEAVQTKIFEMTVFPTSTKNRPSWKTNLLSILSFLAKMLNLHTRLHRRRLKIRERLTIRF